jgi:hypothetical protein
MYHRWLKHATVPFTLPDVEAAAESRTRLLAADN